MPPRQREAPCVSVIVAAYNVESYIEQCLRSLKRQTLESIQIIVVDDGSTDSTPELIKGLSDEDGHPLEYIRQENAGLSAARNTGMAAATGTYIGFVDGDDWVSPAMFEKLYLHAERTRSEVAVCAALRRGPGRQRRRVRLRIPVEEFGTSVTDNPEILWGAHSYAWNKIYARDLIERESFEFPPGKLFEDSSAVYGLLAKANRVAALNEALYQYRVGRPDAITRRADPRIYDIFDACDSFRESLAALESTPGAPEVVERLARTHLFARLPTLRTSRSPMLAAVFSYRALRYLDTHFPGWRKRYRRGHQPRARYYSRRTMPVVVLTSLVRPTSNVLLTDVRRRRAALRGRIRCALAIRRVDRAFRPASVPYTLDLSSLGQANEREALTGRVEIAVLGGDHTTADIAILLRQQRFRLVRSYVQHDRCFAQRWRLAGRFFGGGVVEMRFVEVGSDDTTTRFFFDDGDAATDNEGAIAQLRSPRPGPIEDRRLPLAGDVRAVGPTDPFAATRTSPEFERPRDFHRLALELPEVEIAADRGCYYDGMPPIGDRTAERARSEQLDILRNVQAFCETHDLDAMLADGSLLGAVRHAGYIPWDDDIDLWMIREDFDRFVAAEMPDGFAVLHHTTNERFHLAFAKVVRLDSAFEWSFPADLDPAGASIDIFPLDWSGSPERLAERARARLVLLLRQIVRAKYRFPEARRRSRAAVARLLPGPTWHRILNAVVTAPPLGARTNLTSWFSAYPPRRASYPATWIRPVTELEFEDLTIPAPREPERVLTRTYDDYSRLPKSAKRTTANHFLKLRGGDA